MKKVISKEEKAMWLEDWRQSGKKAWTYARENGLVPQTFTNWTRPRKRAKQPFIELPAHKLEIIQVSQELRIEKGGIIIYVPLTAGITEIQKVVTALAG